MSGAITDRLKSMICAAAAGTRPFALWRMPGETVFRAAIAMGSAHGRHVFLDAARPFFALGRFDTPDANRPEAIDADLYWDGSRALYWTGERYADTPAAHHEPLLGEGMVDVTMPDGHVPHATGEAAYEALVAAALDEIAAGRCRKIVLSRADVRPLTAGTDPLAVAERLAARHPSAFVALAYTPAAGLWLAATPETFLRIDQHRIATMALAGTQWPAPDADLAALTWPPKIIEEQRLVADFVRAAFAAAAITGVDETPAHTVRAAKLCHLRSDFVAPRTAGDTARLPALLAALHPTPAVCGLPRPAAHAFITAREGYDRGCYTGFLGPVGFGGATDLFVNLRSAQLFRGSAALYVGGGIVAGSEPALEWRETMEKSRTIGDVLFAAAPARA